MEQLYYIADLIDPDVMMLIAADSKWIYFTKLHEQQYTLISM